MAIQVTTIRKVLDTLNGKDKEGPWHEVPNYFHIQSANLEGGRITPTNTEIATKVFTNSQTGEIKLYVAKWIEENASKLLS